MMDNAVMIQLSKSKLTLMFLGSLVFVGLGIWFVTNPPQSNHPIFGNPTLLFVVGLASVLFFGLCGYFLFKKLRDNTPGLIISAKGITDNASGVSVGFVPWTDITEIAETTVANQIFINVVVQNPQTYIDQQSSAFKRKIIQMNYNSFGTVISISANGLKGDHSVLKALLDTRFADFKTQTQIQ